MPTYIDRICESMGSPINKQAINWHEKNSHNDDYAMWKREIVGNDNVIKNKKKDK